MATSCGSVSIIDDDVFEETELFSVGLFSESDRVLIPMNSSLSIIEIVDSDGKKI